MEYAFKPDKILTLDSFIEIVEAVDEKVHKSESDKIEKLKKIQGALYEILTKAHKYEMDMVAKPDQLFPYQTFIQVVVITAQLPQLAYTTEIRNLIV